MINKIQKQIHFYETLGYTNLKIVMTSAVATEIQPDNISTENMLFGLPVEINDKIIVDFYVTEMLR